MLRFTSIVLSAFVLSLGASAASAVDDADTNKTLDALLDAPAPAADWRTWPGGPGVSRNPDGSPLDDAPIDVVLAFWSSEDYRGELTLRPSDRVRQRLLAGSLEQPRFLSTLLEFDRLPATRAAMEQIKAAYDKHHGETEFAEDWSTTVHDHLMTHGDYFRADLVAAAAAPPAPPQSGYEDYTPPEGGGPLTALAELDFPAAVPILQKRLQEADPHRTTPALVIYYQHACKVKDAAQAAEYRGKLETIVANQKAPPMTRYQAVNALLARDWPGRDEYYLSLFSDQTLQSLDEGHNYMVPLRHAVQVDPDHWIPLLAKCVAKNDGAIRDAAVSALFPFPSPESPRADALAPLLPWLDDVNWSSSNGRLSLIQGLSQLDLPQSVPALIKIVENEPGDERATAAEALAHYKAKGAGSALRKAYADEPDTQHLRAIAAAMIACDALSIDEIVAAMERYARATAAEPVANAPDPRLAQNLPRETALGCWLYEFGVDRPGPATAILARANVLQTEEPQISRRLRQLVEKWGQPEVDLETVRLWADGDRDTDAILAATERAPALRRNAAAELRTLGAKGGFAGGLAVGILGDAELSAGILNGRDLTAKIAMLAAARLARTPLPLDAVARLMSAETPRLAKAAERYLIAEDNSAARKLVLARYPGGAVILGDLLDARDVGVEGEKALRAEVLQKGGPEEIIALFGGGGFGSPGDIFIRISKQHATISFMPGGGKSLERPLSDDESNHLRSFIAERHVDDLPPLGDHGVSDGWWFNYVHLTRDGGKRLSMNNPDVGEAAGTAYDSLTKLIRGLSTSGDFKIHYALMDSIPGARVDYSDRYKSIAAVWKSGADIRVRLRDDGEPTACRTVRDGKLTDKVELPADWDDIWNRDSQEGPPGLSIKQAHNNELWKRRAGNDTFWLADRTGEAGGGGLWRWRKGEEPVRVTRPKQAYIYPVVTPSGGWAIATDFTDGWVGRHTLLRINLRNGEQHAIDLPEERLFGAVAYLEARDRVLVFGRHDLGEGRLSEPKYWLVDPATGKAQSVTGEFRPLEAQTYRPLQATGGKNKAWAALANPKGGTAIGVYDTDAFVFKPVLTIPDCSFSSMDLWVNAADGRAYFVANGDLISVPINSPK